MSNTLLSSVLIAAVPVSVPFLAALYKLLLTRLPSAQRARLAETVRSAVVAAEQVYRGIPGSSQAKKEFVISRVRALFGKRVSAALVEILLEEAVLSLPHSGTPVGHSAI